MVEDIGFVPIDKRNLTTQKFGIFQVWLVINVEAYYSFFRDWNHVVKAELSKIAIFNSHDMMTRLNFSVTWLRRLHWHKIFIITYKQNNAYIWPAAILVILDSVIAAFQITYVFVRYPIQL